MKRRLRCADDYVLAGEDLLRKATYAEAKMAQFLAFGIEKHGEEAMRESCPDDEWDERMRQVRLFKELGFNKFRQVRAAELIEKEGGDE